jgi:hypothetical protein
MLTSCEIAQLADDVALVQTSSVTLSRASSASDGLGGRSNTYTTVATYAARVTPIGSQQAEEEIGSKIKDGTYFRVALPAGTDVRIGDRLTYGSLIMSVEAVAAPGTLELERRVVATRAAR